MVTKQRDGQGLYTPDKTDRKVASVKSAIKCALAYIEATESGGMLFTQLSCRPAACRNYQICRHVQVIFERNTI